MQTKHWADALPRPLAFAFSGGANLGAIQVGMLRALRRFGIYPDIIVGTSVGALNGAIIANHGLDRGTDVLNSVWRNMRRQDVFPGGLFSQAMCLIRTRLNLFRNDQLGELICRNLDAQRIEDLTLSFGAVATELSTQRGVLFNCGRLKPALLASAALPGIYPPVEINGALFVDGGLAANVPLKAAVEMGAASIVVLDVGSTCEQGSVPKNVAEMVMSALQTSMRQRVLVEAPMVSRTHPVVYLPAPCPINARLLEFDTSANLIDETEATVMRFLETAAPPVPGTMAGAPHFHDEGITCEQVYSTAG